MYHNYTYTQIHTIPCSLCPIEHMPCLCMQTLTHLLGHNVESETARIGCVWKGSTKVCWDFPYFHLCLP